MRKASLSNLSSLSLKRSAKEMESNEEDEGTVNSSTKTDKTHIIDKNVLFLDKNDTTFTTHSAQDNYTKTGVETNASYITKQKEEKSEQNDFKRDVPDDSKSNTSTKRANKRKIGINNTDEKESDSPFIKPLLSTTRKLRYQNATKFQAKSFEFSRKHQSQSESSTKEQGKTESNNSQTNDENKVDRSVNDEIVNENCLSDATKRRLELNKSYTVVHACQGSASYTSSEDVRDVDISYCLQRPEFQPCCPNLLTSKPTAYSKDDMSMNVEHENFNWSDKETGSLSTDKSTNNKKLNIKFNRPKIKSIIKTETKYGKINSAESNCTKQDSNEESDYTCLESISSFSVKSYFMETTSTFRAAQIDTDQLNECERNDRQTIQNGESRKRPVKSGTDGHKNKFSKPNSDRKTSFVKPAVPYRESVTIQNDKTPSPKSMRKSNYTPAHRRESYKDILYEHTKSNTKECNEEIKCDKEKSREEKNENAETSDENISVDINLPVGKIYKISAQNLFTVVISDTQNKTKHKKGKDHKSKREISDHESESTGMSSSEETNTLRNIITRRKKGKIREIVPGPSKNSRKQYRDHQIMLYNQVLKKAIDETRNVDADTKKFNILKNKLYKKKNDNIFMNDYIRENMPTNLKDQSMFGKENIISNNYDKEMKQTNKNSSICYKTASNERPPWSKTTNYQQLNTDEEESLKSSGHHERRDKRLKKLQSQNSKKRGRLDKADKNGLSNDANNSKRGDILFCTNNKNLISNLVTNEVSTSQSQTLLVYSDGIQTTSQDDVCYRGLRYLNTRTSDTINISGMKSNKKKGCFQWLKKII